MSTARGLKTYLAEARSWDDDRLSAALRSRRLAWIIAAGGCSLATLACIAVAALAPLKTVEPFVVRVDRSSGAVDVMTALTGDQPHTYDEAVSKYFLATYVRARETWLPAAAQANFDQAVIMSAPSEQQRLAQIFRPNNPQSPQVVLGPSAQAVVEVRAVTFLSPSVGQVRFRRTVERAGQVEAIDWIATITFAYAKGAMKEGDRLRNPLGFQVADYRADPEAAR
ncbi:virB8 family protein [Caulobacter sp. NIBR2454]|uniref:virB8 family protein n=1 Tax=Caulobacter sp. NIBR2454 TaxID=3015996 RepID=UPI0022B7134E|nr:virB8 family protein [Caulobacter sp. NIBR2454]